MAEIIVVNCQGCHGGENGEKTSCLSSIRSVVENNNIAFMMFSGHVKEKLDMFNYKIVYRYADNNPSVPIGMWIMNEAIYETHKHIFPTNIVQNTFTRIYVFDDEVCGKKCTIQKNFDEYIKEESKFIAYRFNKFVSYNEEMKKEEVNLHYTDCTIDGKRMITIDCSRFNNIMLVINTDELELIVKLTGGLFNNTFTIGTYEHDLNFFIKDGNVIKDKCLDYYYGFFNFSIN